MKRSLLVLIGAALLATGCAHSVQSKLHPAFETGLPATRALSAVRPAISLGDGAFSDARPDTTLLTSFQTGIHTYNFHADRPVSGVLFEGMHALFARAGHTWTNGTNVPRR